MRNGIALYPRAPWETKDFLVGDQILDRYIFGDAERVSPEAPVVVLSADDDEVRPGGAASVASLVRALGGDAILAGVVGADANGRILRRLLTDEQIDVRNIIRDSSRPTTSKERFIGRAPHGSPHQILRVDRESREPLGTRLADRLSSAILCRLSECDALLISDYGKGVCTPKLLAALISAAADRNVPVIVDPARITDYRRYSGASVLIPNRREAELAGGRQIRSPADALEIAGKLGHDCAVGAVIVKLDREGMALVELRGDRVHEEVFPTRQRAVCDVTGAGDMVLAMVGLCAAQTVPLGPAVRLANIAAGLEVERLGVAPVDRAEIAAEILRGEQRSGDKRLSAEQMAVQSQEYRRQGRSLVFTNGCFDMLHAGHVAYLQQAAQLGSVLVVALNSDASVRRLKGPGRPVIGERSRAALIAALGCVEHVVVFDDDTPNALLRAVRPDVLVKGGDYAVEDVVGREIVAAYGGRVCVVEKVDGVSTSQIVSAVRRNGAMLD